VEPGEGVRLREGARPIAAPDAADPLPENLKILHVFDHSLPLHSGYSFRSLALLREQRRRGWQTAHLTTPKHTLVGPEMEEIEGLSFYRTGPVSGLGASLPGIAEARLIRSVARRIREVAAIERPAVLHAHSPVLNALACLLAARELKLPVVYEVRAFWEDAAVANGTTREGSLRYRLTRGLETFALRQCAAIIAICEGLAADIGARGISENKISLVPNGVELGEFPRLDRERPSAAATALMCSLGLEGKLVLGFLGSFYPYEGLDLLLDAMPAVLRARPEVRLVLAGGGQDELKLKAQARSLGLEEFVRFVGRIAHSEIIHYHELIDVFVFPRRGMRLTETVTPLKPLEAMATGGIVLASDVGGHRELVAQGETGFLCPVEDPDLLARAIIETIGARAAWEGVRDRARAFVEARRTWETCTAAYERAYACALHARVINADSHG
jgi:PEP-CTERM/exosortase A-associated glycosyltransferase